MLNIFNCDVPEKNLFKNTIGESRNSWRFLANWTTNKKLGESFYSVIEIFD